MGGTLEAASSGASLFPLSEGPSGGWRRPFFAFLKSTEVRRPTPVVGGRGGAAQVGDTPLVSGAAGGGGQRG